MSSIMVITSTVKDGMTDAWKDVAAKATASSRDEPGTTTYGWYLGDDGNAHNLDVFSDDAAFAAHLQNMTEAGLIDAWMASVDVKSVAVLGTVSDEVKEMLAAFGAVHYPMVDGF